MGLHPDTDRVITELCKAPEFSSMVDDSTPDRVSAGLYEVDEALEMVGRRFFEGHPGESRTPYGVYLVPNPETKDFDVVVRVGNKAMNEIATQAAARLMHGELQRRLIKKDPNGSSTDTTQGGVGAP